MLTNPILIDERISFIKAAHHQALKYLLQGRLTECPMTLSLGRTYVMMMSDDHQFSLARK